MEVEPVRARYFISTCVAAVMALSYSIEGQAASLETELTNMLVEHPQLKSKQETTLGSEKSIDVAKAAYLPTVALTSDYGYEWITSPSERTASDGKNDSSMTRQVAGLTITQKIFDGYATDSAIKTAKLTNDETQSSEEITRQTLLFEGITVYINVLKQVRRIKYARENEANIKQQMELEDERVRRGSGIGIDVLNAKSRLQSAKDKRVEYEGELAKAVDQYIQVFNHAPDLAAMNDPSPPIDLLPTDMEGAIEYAIKMNPNVLNANILSDKADENKRTVRSQYYPSVDLNGAMNYERDKNATAGTRRDWSLLVEANWELFSGFSTEYSMRKAVYDYGSSKNNALYTSRKVAEAASIAWHTLETSQERLALMENDVILKEEIFQSTRKQRESGAEGVDVLNVLDREKEVYEVKIKYAELFYDTRLSIYGVLLTLGNLTPDSLGLDS